ncbi:hypothetical protein RHMOL_Rhmol07G0167200 [Rhododendron molle]|uniref:Uncharacterized protein n=2 Tax=Rhododendron molle TaxID=49168 RepID=A0ACC0N1N5_RHOML|nr:hypothetical protein RHMOL_Rhmol07G0167200 [Rhododendron molle]KAI8547080.1 hypothetical protein RHMOL_Rhmol07G0167200 [Rhododendron molle]
MKKRSTRKPTAADFLVSPPPTASPNRSPSESPKEQFEFDLGAFNKAASSSKKRKKDDVASSSVDRIQNVVGSPLNMKSLSTISDLKEMAASRLDSIKHQLDRSHTEIVKDLEASQSRLHKRFKIQTQACQQVVDEAEKEYKKISDRISESREAMKASYLKFLAEAQASASRVCKTSIPELSQSFEKSLDVLRSRYGISSNAM